MEIKVKAYVYNEVSLSYEGKTYKTSENKVRVVDFPVTQEKLDKIAQSIRFEYANKDYYTEKGLCDVEIRKFEISPIDYYTFEKDFKDRYIK